MVAGDLWINNEQNQLYFYDGTDLRIPGRVIDNWIEVKTDNYQLAVNKNYMIDSGALTGLPMNLTMPSSAKMGDTIILMEIGG